MTASFDIVKAIAEKKLVETLNEIGTELQAHPEINEANAPEAQLAILSILGMM
jgi:hypothetical protein